jgi:NAD(P)-dependent dehydrogenase (short-subunit alcohol dehydrogenase family)
MLDQKHMQAAGHVPLALIIGCGGLGLGTARALGKHHPLLIVDIAADRLAAAVDTLRLEGYDASGRQCDITDAVQVGALGQALSRRAGVSVLAHIAAIGNIAHDWREMMAVDLIGPHLIADAVQPHMARGGVAIFVGSLAGYLPPIDARIEKLLDAPLEPGFLDEMAVLLGDAPQWIDTYAYAKLGVMRLAEKRAIAWGRRGVRALSLSPGLIDSPMARAQGATLPSHDGEEREVSRDEKAKEVPLGREGTMLEIISVLEFLASDGARFINGIDIVVDGGHRAYWRDRAVITR